MADVSNARIVLAQVVNLVALNDDRRLGSRLHCRLQLGQMLAGVALQLEFITLPSEDRPAAIQTASETGNEILQLGVVAEDMRCAHPISFINLDAYLERKPRHVGGNARAEPLKVYARRCLGLTELGFVEHLRCVRPKRRIWVQQKRLGPRARDAPPWHALDFAKHGADLRRDQDLHDAAGRHDVVTLPDVIRIVKGRQPAFWRALERWLNFGHRRAAHFGLTEMKFQFFRGEHHRSVQKVAKFGFGFDSRTTNFSPLLPVKGIVVLGVGPAVEGTNHPRETPYGLGKQPQFGAGLYDATA